MYGKKLVSRVALGLAVATSFAAVDAQAQESEASDTDGSKKRVLVGKLAGAKPTSVRGWIVEGLENDLRFEVVGEKESLVLPTGSADHRIAEIAETHQADAVVLGTSRFGKGWNAEIEVYDGKTGELIEKVKVQAGSFSNYEDALKGGNDYFPLIEKAEGFAPEPEPVVDLEEDESEEETIEVDRGDDEGSEEKGRPSPLDVSLGIRLYSRAFRYTDTLAQLGSTDVDPLIDYNLDAGPMPMLHLNWFPAAHFGGGIASHIGITGGFEQGVATQVQYEDQSFSQNHSYFYAGLRGRIPVSMFTFGVTGKYAGHSFTLDDSGDGAPTDLFPNVSYSLLEFGADAEARIGKISLGVRGAYLLRLGLGDIATDDWYPDATAMGVSFGGHVGYSVSPMFDILAGVDVRAYAFDFAPVVGVTPDNRVAGGATDRYISAFAALRFVLPGDPADESQGGSGSDSSDGGDDLDFD